MVAETSKWVDISTVVAATAGLWALTLAWWTYVKSVDQQNEDEFQALKSIVGGLRVELELMKAWTATEGQGYVKAIATTPPPEWSQPGRLIWKFDIGAVSNLTRSPYLYRLGDIIKPFARLNFSVSRLFQLYDEYRSFVNSPPVLALLRSGPDLAAPIAAQVLDFNVRMHVKLIGGADSDDPACLYKAYNAATDALAKFEADLKQRKPRLPFYVGHLFSAVCFVAGLFLLYSFFCH
jgi:hypothetical protein